MTVQLVKAGISKRVLEVQKAVFCTGWAVMCLEQTC